MTEPDHKKKNYVHERIVPRKQYKKLLSLGFAAVILGILFGAMAGITFYVSQGILNKNSTSESPGETIIIARDQDPQSSSQSESTEEPAEEPAPSTEWSADISISEADDGSPDDETGAPEETAETVSPDDAGGGAETWGEEAEQEDREEDIRENTETVENEEMTDSGDEPEEDTEEPETADESASSGEEEDSIETGSEETETPDEPEEEPEPAEQTESQESGGEPEAEPSGEEYGPDVVPSGEDEILPEEEEPDPGDAEETAALTLRDMYARVSDGLVTVTIRDSEGTDLFDQPVTSRRDQFGVIIFESEEYLYILTDGTGIKFSSEVTMSHANRKVEVTIQGQDTLTNMMVLRARRQDFRYPYTVLELGNSFLVSPAEYVWMAGSPDGMPGAVDYGVVTYVNRIDEVTDGYRQLFITNMQRSPGGSSVLFNTDCEIIGWVSDYSSGESERVYAAGISPLKYVIEDLCSAVDTAYLGVRCLTVNTEKSEETGLPTGLYVTDVEPNSPSYMMGIQAGDRIVSINDITVNDSRGLQDILDRLESGKETVLVIERQGKDGEEPIRVVLYAGKR